MTVKLEHPERAEYYTISNGSVTVTGKLDPSLVVESGLPGAGIIHNSNYNTYLEETEVAGVVYPDLPPEGTELQQDDIYLSSEGNVIVRQSHTRTNDLPSTVPALFLTYRPEGDGTLVWIENENVMIGDKRVYEGEEYEVIQSHATQTGWEPPNTPALWKLVPVEPGEEWAVGVAYEIDDEATYEDIWYACIQPHTSQAGWEPPNVPALWSVI